MPLRSEGRALASAGERLVIAAGTDPLLFDAELNPLEWPAGGGDVFVVGGRAGHLVVAREGHDGQQRVSRLRVLGPAGAAWDLVLPERSNALVLSPDARLLACVQAKSGWLDQVCVWSLDPGAEARPARAFGWLKAGAVAVLAGGALVIGDGAGQVALVAPDADGGEALVDPELARDLVDKAHGAEVRDLAASPDGGRLYSLASLKRADPPPGELKVWDLPGRRLLRGLPAPPGATWLALSPDGALLAVAAPGRVELWRTRDLEEDR
ncbi:MAG: hypothetical protein M9894_35805 [Planctomycetes bacterium]|nr:hypothetical protein [Planctomycetota bacterium]